jgi:putative membrane protein
MVAWFAGLFYLFRLLVNQVENREHAHTADTLAVMAHRLFHIITVPAMVATLFLGASLLLVNPDYLAAGWLWAKLAGVAGLVAYTLYVGRTCRRFAEGDYYLTSRQCRIRNEVPTVFLICIVLLAVLRPWS